MGLNDQTGVGGFIEIGGRQLQLHPLRPEDFAAAKSFLRMNTENPFEAAKKMVEGLAVEVQKAVLGRAYEEYLAWGSLHTEMGRQWAASVEGVSYFVWRSLRERQPDLADEMGRLWVFEQLQEMAANEMALIMDEVQHSTGFDERDPTLPTGGKKRRNRKASSKRPASRKKNGTNSTGSSPKDTTGQRRKRLLDLPSPSLETSLEAKTIGGNGGRKGKGKSDSRQAKR